MEITRKYSKTVYKQDFMENFHHTTEPSGSSALQTKYMPSFFHMSVIYKIYVTLSLFVDIIFIWEQFH